MHDICGPSLTGSSASAGLQRSLESRLRAQNFGSIWFAMIWKDKVTPAGRQYCQLAPLGLRTGGIASGLLPTPQARDHFPAHSAEYVKKKRALGHGMSNLNDFVAHEHLGLWPTPRSSPNENRQKKKITPSQACGKHGLSLAAMANLWPTPTASRRSGLQSHGKNVILGVLNPQWVAWLLGYPINWSNLSCAGLVTLLSRKSQRSL